MIHQLKIETKWFEKKLAGIKAWEMRLNDRNFKVGDYLALNEVDPNGVETGRSCMERIVDVALSEELYGAVGKDFVILSTEPSDIDGMRVIDNREDGDTENKCGTVE